MNKEFSYGAVILKKEGAVSKFLMIYSGRNNIWGFPKGHIDLGESEKEAALREIQEETGLNALKFIDGFREEDVYQAISNRGINAGQEIEKHSIYYLCEASVSEVVVDNEEITEYRWLSISEADKLLAFDSLKQILHNAEAFMTEDSN